MRGVQNLFAPEIENISQKPCVYVILWIRDGKPVSISRVLATCKKGVLYIGSSNNLRRRLRDLKISIETARDKRKRKEYPHTFGPSLAYTGLVRIILDDELYV